MTRRLLLLLLLVFLISNLASWKGYAQTLSIQGVVENTSNVIGREDTRLDLNNQPCALLKITMPCAISRIEGNYIGEPIQKNVEQWVYVTSGTNRINIFPEGYLPVNIDFTKFGIRRVKGGLVYQINLVENIEGEDWSAEELLGMASASWQQKNYAKTYYWTKQAIEKGSVLAIHSMGFLYLQGNGVEKNEEKAFSYFKQAAEMGNILSIMMVVDSYLEGRGIPKDTIQAISWLHKAMEKDNATAYATMATFYEKGKGMEKDERKAFEMMKQSVDKGFKYGLLYLAKYYELGIGTEPDHQAALGELRNAKKAGLNEAGIILERLAEEEYKQSNFAIKKLFLDIFEELVENSNKNYSALEQPHEIRLMEKDVYGFFTDYTLSFSSITSHSYGGCKSKNIYWSRYYSIDDEVTRQPIIDKRTGDKYYIMRTQPQLSPDGKSLAIIGRNKSISGYAVHILNIFTGTKQILDLESLKTDSMLKKDLQAISWLTENTLCLYSAHGTFKYSLPEATLELMEGVNGYVQLSADGKNLYWEDYSDQVWTKSVGVSKPRILTTKAADITLFGDYIYFRRNSNEDVSEIYRLNVKTMQEQRVLSHSEHGFGSPQVSPDGKLIAVMGNALSANSKKQNLDIFIANIDGTDLRQLTDHPGNDESPVWSADGTQLYFLSQRRTDGTKWEESDNRGWLYRMSVKQSR